MYVDICTYKRKNKTYRRVLLREGYRENGKVKHRTLANLSHCSPQEIEALRIALKKKEQLSTLHQLANAKATNGKHVGAVASLYQVAQRLGILKALGTSQPALLVLWLIFARLLEQGSRLSAVRLAQTHAVCELLALEAFTEEDLYQAMDWLSTHQQRIEKQLFGDTSPAQTFLYDVTSSYLEGAQNELAHWGYNRDGKKGKQQLVYGLLTRADGDPVAVEAFAGNISDPKTLKAQIDKLKVRFGCESITLVGDKGMIKSAQITALQQAGFHYITSITKSQIETLLKAGLFQMDLFDDPLGEVEDAIAKVRYVLRRNPLRAKEMAQTRKAKLKRLKEQLETANHYLKAHPKAKVEVQLRYLNALVQRLKMNRYISLEGDEQTRQVHFTLDREGLLKVATLDGCYAIKTDLPKKWASKQLIHDRYLELSQVEWAFRTEKTGYLEVRPVYVRKRQRTAAHLLITMLAYKIERYLRSAWKEIDLTVEEGIKRLAAITSVILTIGEEKLFIVPQPDNQCQALLDEIQVILPEGLPYRQVDVATRKKLMDRRKK